MIVPEDELTIQRMLGVLDVPADIHDEYLRRVRFLHREVAGGPIGPGMLVDLLRFLGYEPAVSGSKQQNDCDWREIERGTRVQIRRNGYWTEVAMECRFEGFVDSGTLAVLLPGGRVDEFARHDVRIANLVDAGIETPGVTPTDMFELAGSMRDGRAETDARTQQLESSAEVGDTVSPVLLNELPHQYPPGELNESGELRTLEEPSPAAWPVTDWKNLKKGDPVWAREVIDGEVELYEGKFVKKSPKIVKVLLVDESGQEIERAFPEGDVRQPDA